VSLVYLDLEDLPAVANALLGESLRVRDHGLLQAAAARPRTTVLGEDAYPTMATKAAALLESLVRSHGLVDGNKRLAWASTALFYELNGMSLLIPAAEAYPFMMAAAVGDVSFDEIALWLARWAR
jgi:death-on-curing protein